MTRRSHSPIPPRHRARLAAAVGGLLFVGLVQAQYKLVGPDGKVTYTDRPPPPAAGKATTLSERTATAPAEVALPLELRQASSRYPATLYVTPTACDPCDKGRALLRQRGVPFTEKLIVRREDSDALERLTGSRDAPTLTLGGQTLRGFSSELWTSYLDAAGYPAESRLPGNYRYAAPSPLTEVTAAAPAAPTQRPAARPAPAQTAEVPPPTPGGIRF